MEIRVLRYFLETAREGNITRAAERLHVTQPTMSRQLKDLEEELGKKLFVRTNYALRLYHGRRDFYRLPRIRFPEVFCQGAETGARAASRYPLQHHQRKQ